MPAQQDLSWKTRLKAWWEGYDTSGLGRRAKPARRRANSADGPEPEPVAETAGPMPFSRIWSVDRVNLAEAIWGQGFHTPCGTDHLATLIKPLALDETMSVLNLGAGPGGIAHMIARTTGAWVTGLDADPVLAWAGMNRSLKAGLAKRAPIQAFNAERPEFDKRYDAMVAKECFFTVHRKEELFAAIVQALKPRAQLQFTDYVLKHSAGGGTVLNAWRSGEPERPYPWTIAQIADRLRQLGCDIRITEDISDSHRSMILTAWDRLTTILPHRKADDDFQELIMQEGELWMRRIAALETGDLRIYRFYALGPKG